MTHVIAVFLVHAMLNAAAPNQTKGCPETILRAVSDKYTDARVLSCKEEKGDAGRQFEVVITTHAKKLEIDVSDEGAILQTEERIALADLPAVVASGVAGKYPKVKLTSAQRQVKANATVTYEVAFRGNGKTHEATFDATGKFIDEE